MQLNTEVSPRHHERIKSMKAMEQALVVSQESDIIDENDTPLRAINLG